MRPAQYLIIIIIIIISPKVMIACNGFCLLRHTKPGLHVARDIISYSGTMFSRVLYYIVNFEIIALDKYLMLFFERYLLSHARLLCHVSALLTSACKQA